MRLLKFIGVFLLTALVIFGFVIGLNWNAFSTFFENRTAMMEGSEWVPKTGSLKGLSEFMGETPEYSSLASVVVSSPDSAIYYQEEKARIMGTTANYFILVAYASRIDSGLINPKELIKWSDISEYLLPEVENTLHKEAFDLASERGWIVNGEISLENALALLSQYGDLALADYLWWQLDSDIWKELTDTLKLSQTEMPLPYSGLYQAISPGLNETTTSALIEKWDGRDPEIWRAHVVELSRDYKENAEFRDSVREYMKENRLGNTFMQERDAMVLFPKTTADEMTRVLKRMVNDSLINQKVSRMVIDFMDWPMDSQPRIDEDFHNYGAIYDNRMGLMNGIDFGTSAYTGDTTVQALYLDRLPIGFWFHASGSQMHQDFMQRLIYDPAMIEQMYSIVKNRNEPH